MVQRLASTILIFSILILEKEILTNEIFIIIQFSLLIKLGIAPFHWWLPEVIEGLSWINCLLILTWQKIAPIIIIIITLKNSVIINLTIIISSLVRGIQGLNQIRIKKIITYSSINHIAWILIRIIRSSWTWIIYFSIYTIRNIILVLFFYNFKIYFINQINSINNNKIQKTFVLLNFLSLRGIPPIIGFLPKWLTIHFIIKNFRITLTFILIVSSILHIYFYIRIIIPSLIIKIKEPKINQPKNYINYPLITLNLIFLLRLPIIGCLI